MPPAPIILHQARVVTMDERLPRAEALVLGEGKVLLAGSSAQALEFAGDGSQVVPLGGRTVLPGLVDAHVHFEQYARSLDQVDCAVADLTQCLQRVAEAVRRSDPGTWILGHGWNQNDWGGFPSATDLDRVSPHHPVYLTARSLHAAWANSTALRTAGISQATPDPPGGTLLRDSAGRPTGVLLEKAMQLVSTAIPPPTPAALARAMLAAMERLWRLGLTGIHDFDGPRCFRALQLLREQDLLGLRVVKNIPVEHLEAALELGLRSGFGDDWIRMGNIKLFADGALGPRTAAMLAPYDGESENAGVLLLDSEAVLEIGMRAVEAGLALAVHAIGDRANHAVLSALESLREREIRSGLPRRRHRVEHLQLVHPDDLSLAGRLGLIASMQPIHATSDMEMADRYWHDRVDFAYAWRSQLEAGATLAFGSDAPVESPNPFWGLHAAVTRRRRDGSPGPSGWVPVQRLRLDEALRAYTLGPAYAAGQEGHQGRLAPGCLADLIVLDQDPFEIPPEELAELKPVATMVGGVWRFREF